MDGIDVVFHLAAQVAVTTSVADPRLDFEVNALGTLNVLEAARLSRRRPILVYASTNKVYGSLSSFPVRNRNGRYAFPALPRGVPESAQLDFHSPYGCSKGSADQYVVDYARIYGLPTVVFRQSCIYGPWQYGNEDQGWVAHFARSVLAEQPIVIYGDGLQVRDVLYVDDLVAAFDLAVEKIGRAAGRAYNIGGGPAHAVSLRECVGMIEGLVGRPADVTYGDWRPGDQRVYVSDVSRAAAELGWEPGTSFAEGLRRLVVWLRSLPDVSFVEAPAGAGRAAA